MDLFRKIILQQRFLFILLFIILLNLLYLDIVVFQKIKQNPSSLLEFSDNGQCSSACVTKINEAVSSLTNILPTLTSSSSPTPTKTPPVFSGSSSSVAKEYYVPFGSGSGSSSDWQDVPGLQAYVDSTAYQNIKQVVFEASLHIPTGNETASVRLYNATDGHPVWNSEVNFNGNTLSVFLSSQPVSLDIGNKLYKVQMKTQLQYPAILDQSRLHITTK